MSSHNNLEREVRNLHIIDDRRFPPSLPVLRGHSGESITEELPPGRKGSTFMTGSKQANRIWKFLLCQKHMTPFPSWCFFFFSFGNSYSSNGRLPWWLRRLRTCLQCRRPGFDRWVRKISWRREWQPTPVFTPGEFHG